MLATFFAKYTCRKRQTYQNEAKNLCSLLFVFDLDSECKFIKNKKKLKSKNDGYAQK